MDDKDILQRIVDENGSCDWLDEQEDGGNSICDKCPMSNLLKDKDGNRVACYIALKAHEVSDPDKLYYDKAVEILIDLSMEETLAECT